MTRKALLTLLGIAALVALATAPALGQIAGAGGGTESAAAADEADIASPSQQSLQAIMNLRVAQSGAGSQADPNASELAAAGVAVAFVAVQISLHRTLRRRSATA